MSKTVPTNGNASGSPPPTASRASWIGTLQAGSLETPVKAYSAIASATEGQLHQAHAGCGERITSRKCCPLHGELTSDQIAKAYPYQADQLIELSEKDLDSIRHADNKTILLERFFAPAQIDWVLFSGRSLYLAPANAAARPAYAKIFTALTQQNTWALGSCVFSGRRQLVVVHPVDKFLLLHVLHNPALRRAAPFRLDDFHRPSRAAAWTKRFAAKKAPIPWHEYRDDTEEKLAALVVSKLSARKAPGSKTTNRLRAANGTTKPARTPTAKAA